MKLRYMLGHFRQTQNFVQYPACKDVNILAQFGLVDIIFPDVDTTTNLQVSVVDCNTNTLVYKEDCTPFLANEVVTNIRYSIVFNPFVGGYVITSPSCPVKSQPAKDEKSEEVGDTK